MPPCRLRWSRRLGRPVMQPYVLGILYGDVIGVAFIEELHPYEAMISATRMRGPFPHQVMVWSTQCRDLSRYDLWEVTIIDENF